MKRILDPAFEYRPSYATDVRKTFEAARREQAPGSRASNDPTNEGRQSESVNSDGIAGCGAHRLRDA